MKTRIKEELHNLECELTPTEHTERSNKLARALGKKDELEGELEKFRSRNKAETKDVEADIRHLAKIVRTNKERRQVKVHIEKDLIDKIERIMRTDTGEIIETRHLTEQELQADLPLEPRRSKGGESSEDLN